MSEPVWHILQSKPGAELALDRDLRRIACTGYCPVEVRTVVRRGRKVEVSRPLIPGYVFVASAAYAAISRLPDCAGFLRASEGRLAVISQAGVDYVRAIEAEREQVRLAAIARRARRAHDFRSGQQVRLASGPLAGQAGTIERLDGPLHIRVLLTMFGRATPVVAKADEIEAA